MTSQNFHGKVYDDEAIVAGVKVINSTQNILTYTNDKGSFSIEASINDIIVLTSLFHLKKSIVLTKKDFEETVVIELKKAVNDLDEVLIKKEPDFKPFDPVEANATLKNQILEDIKRNPHLYPTNSMMKGNIFAVIGLIGKLLKSKKPKEDAQTFATYNELVNYFETDAYFTDKFLRTELKIEDDYKYLFLQFCEAHAIDSKLLSVENQFMLLDVLLKCSEEFLEIVNSDQKD